jgi:Kef-type K+ transport system membrane component KefB
MSAPQLLSLLLLQIAAIVVVCRALGMLMRRIRQPQVIAEMIAGFLLGPSLLGAVAPAIEARLFPADSMPMLYVASQLGLVLYMFCVGIEFRLELVQRLGRTAATVSVAGIAGPMLLGGVLASYLLERPGLFPPAVVPMHAVLFVGAAMSITAFPVLARIISERRIGGTAVGTLALAAGAINDAAAWILLAFVLASFTGNTLLAIAAVAGAVLYALAAIYGARPIATRLAAAAAAEGELPARVLGWLAVMLVLGAWFTEWAGLHAVFGAFVLGAVMPRGHFADSVRGAIEPLTTALLVPLFFVYSGLNTRLSLLDSSELWVIAGLIFLTACAGKGLSCWAAARLSGATNREALSLATLMNTRGMVELILLNIGLQRGLITPTLFTMMVLMAIATTVMTGPLLSLVWERSAARR